MFSNFTRLLLTSDRSKLRLVHLPQLANLVGAQVRLSNLWRRDNVDAGLSGKTAIVVGDPFPYILPDAFRDILPRYPSAEAGDAVLRRGAARRPKGHQSTARLKKRRGRSVR